MKTIAVLIHTKVILNNFITSGALDELSKNFKCILIAPESFRDSLDSQSYFYSADVQEREVFSTIRFHLDFLSMNRYKHRSSTFQLKYSSLYFKDLSFLRKLLASVLSMPLIYEIIARFYEFFCGYEKKFLNLLTDAKPDLIIIPSGFNDWTSISFLKSSKKLNITSFMIMANWDNVASKGVLRILPDHIGVWGEQTKLQAMTIHSIPEENIHVLGSPQFDGHYFPDKFDREYFASHNNFDINFKYFLFLGTARSRDETSILKKLDDLIEARKIDNIGIIYRPHPWRDKSLNLIGQNFFDVKFKHVSLDPSMAEHFQAMMKDPENFSTLKFVPNFQYSVEILQFSEGVIASLTTMGLESMILGKPVLLPIFKDPIFSYSVGEYMKYEHHKCWKNFRHTVISSNIDNFEDDFLKLIEIAKLKEASSEIKDDVLKVVYNDANKYKYLLSEEITKNIINF